MATTSAWSGRVLLQRAPTPPLARESLVPPGLRLVPCACLPPARKPWASPGRQRQSERRLEETHALPCSSAARPALAHLAGSHRVLGPTTGWLAAAAAAKETSHWCFGASSGRGRSRPRGRIWLGWARPLPPRPAPAPPGAGTRRVEPSPPAAGARMQCPMQVAPRSNVRSSRRMAKRGGRVHPARPRNHGGRPAAARFRPGNFQLRHRHFEKAKQPGGTQRHIESAIAKAQGQRGGRPIPLRGRVATTRGYWPPGGVVARSWWTAFTDNPQPGTAADLRLAYPGKNGGNLGETGCVGYLFEQQAVVRIDQSDLAKRRLLGEGFAGARGARL